MAASSELVVEFFGEDLEAAVYCEFLLMIVGLVATVNDEAEGRCERSIHFYFGGIFGSGRLVHFREDEGLH